MKNFGKNMKAVAKTLWGLLGKNIGTKLIALFFAVLLWSIAMAEQNPWREKSLSNVPVTITGKDVLTENDLAVTDGLDVLENGLRLNIEVRQADFYTVVNESLSATVDLSFIREPGEYTVNIQTKGLTNGRVLDINPSTIKVLVERTTERLIPVVYNFEGGLGENYWHGDPVLTPEIVEVKGPVSIVNQIKNAACVIPLDGLTETFHEAVPLLFYDENGNFVDVNNLQDSIPSVIVRMEVLYKKSVPVLMEDNIQDIDTVKAGYFVSDYSVTPRYVDIIGAKEILSEITGLNFEAFSVQNQSSTVINSAPLILPEGVQVLESNLVTVNVTIREQETDADFSKQLQITDLEKGYKATLSEKVIKVNIKGPISIVNNFQPADIEVYVNLAGLTKGTYDVPVEYSITNENVALVIGITPALVSVTID